MSLWREGLRGGGPPWRELRHVQAEPALRRSCIAIAVIGILAPLANAAVLTTHDSARQTANAFTSVNAAVFLAMLLGVLGTTGSQHDRSDQASRSEVLGSKARAYGLIGVSAVVILAVLAAAIALPIIHARGEIAPSSSVVTAYVEREIFAALRLAVIGVVIGVIAVSRWRAVLALIAFLAVEAISEAHVPFIKNYGPIGSLNAFSDPSHRHQLSVGAGAAVALAWVFIALVAADLIIRHRANATKVPEPRMQRTPGSSRQRV
jgi:hypothetical protein